MQKKFKKWQFQKKFILLETTLKVLKYVPNTICIVSYKFQAYISQKKNQPFLKKSLTRDMQKNSKIGKVSKKNYFARNNLKSLKICSKRYLYSF